MATNNYTIAVCVPGITYTSVGPGFIDAIKLEARNVYYPEKTYKVYTLYTTTADKTVLIENPYIYRCVSTTDSVDSRSNNPIASVQYSNDPLRCPYGRFYDYINEDMSNGGGLLHTITCFSDITTISNLESFNVNDRDGIYIIEAEQTDDAIEMLFTFYTRSYDDYKKVTGTTEIEYEEPDSPGNPDDYIVIGTMSKVVRPSTVVDNTVADMIAESSANMYYDLNRETKDTDTLYIPIEGNFTPIKGLNSNSPIQLLSGSDIFTSYNISETITWGDPIVAEIQQSTVTTKTTNNSILSYYSGKDYLADTTQEWFSPPTKVLTNTETVESNPTTITFSISSLNMDNSTLLWNNTCSYALLNVTYLKSFLKDNTKNYAPCVILEFIPELANLKISDESLGNELNGNVNDTNEGSLAGLRYLYGSNPSVMGRVFSYALSQLPYLNYSIMSYVTNFGYTREQHGPIFIYRPEYDLSAYPNTPGLVLEDLNNWKLFNDMSILTCTLSFNDYNIVSDSDLNAIAGYITYKDKSNNIYPLSEYFQKNTPDNSWEWVKDNNQLTLNRWGKSVATLYDIKITCNYDTSLTLRKTFYQHVFTCKDLEYCSGILGSGVIHTSAPNITLDFLTVSTSPRIRFNKRWEFGDLYHIDWMVDVDKTTKSPSRVFKPVNEYYKMKEWAIDLADEASVLMSESYEYKPIKQYELCIILSPMLAVDMDLSSTTFSNKGQYKVIPAYYYGDDSTSGSVLTDYKNQKTNVSIAEGCTIQAIQSGSPDPIISSFYDTKDINIYSLSHTEANNDDLFVTVEISNCTWEAGLYILKFQKYFDNGDIRLNDSDLKIKYFINDQAGSYIAHNNFIVIYIPLSSISSNLKFTFALSGEGSAKIHNFALYKVNTSDVKNMNLVMLGWWCEQAKKLDWSKVNKPLIIPSLPTDDFYNLLYTNIVLPSAVCAYEDFSLFTTADHNENKPGYTKYYKAMYFPKNSIYDIIGIYNIKNTNITNIECLPGDTTQDNIICYNQTSRYA